MTQSNVVLSHLKVEYLANHYLINQEYTMIGPTIFHDKITEKLGGGSGFGVSVSVSSTGVCCETKFKKSRGTTITNRSDETMDRLHGKVKGRIVLPGETSDDEVREI